MTHLLRIDGRLRLRGRRGRRGLQTHKTRNALRHPAVLSMARIEKVPEWLELKNPPYLVLVDGHPRVLQIILPLVLE